MEKIDMVTVEVVGNQLKTIAELMGYALIRSSFSANIKERRDCSTAIFDGKGRLLVQAEHIPLHLGSMLGTVKEVCRKFPGRISKGDVFISNDPFSGGTHLPDITIITPFFRGEMIANFTANIAHHADIGGAQPGGIAGDAETIYEEGLRIPPIKIMKKGVIDQELLEMIIKNCRMPDERKLDLEAQIAANSMGAGYLDGLYKKYDDIIVSESASQILRYTEKRLRSKLKQIPDGRFFFEDSLDDDGITHVPVPIRVCLEVINNRLKIDFTGSGPQSSGAINVVPSALLATVYYVLKAYLDPDLPANAGLERVIEIITPENSVVNPEEPAAVGARTDTCQRIAGALIGALNRAIPERAVAGSNDASTAVVFSKEKRFVYVEAVGGGGGASDQADGLDGIQVHITNTSNLPVEALESEFPLRVEKYEFIPDSGGRGKHRGGLGLERQISVLDDDIIFSSHADRHKIPPWGWNDGGEGSCGQFILNDSVILPSKNSGLKLQKNDVINIKTPGGGGFGSPDERPAELKKKDLLEEKVTEKKIIPR